ncbi:MAG: hypothetical protein AB8C84_00945 [Oligoflexales bacterium]
MKVMSKKSAHSGVSALFLSFSILSVGCSYDPVDEKSGSEHFQVEGEETSQEGSTKSLEGKVVERPIVLKKMKRLSSEPQSLAFTEQVGASASLVCSSFDELREDVKCRVESADGQILSSEKFEWKLSMLQAIDPAAELREIGGDWHVGILGGGLWGLEALRKDGSLVAKIQKQQVICDVSLIEHAGLDGTNRCLETSGSSEVQGFSHLRLINLQAESQQAIVPSSGEEVLGKRGDRVALSLYTSGLPAHAKVGSYGLPILDSEGHEVMRVCMAASDLRLPGWLGAQLRLSGSSTLRVGRPQPAVDDLCRGQSSKSLVIWYEAHIF